MDPITAYHLCVDHLLAALGCGDKMLHVHIGLAIYCGSQVVLRTRRASVDALLMVLVLELANEVLDRLYWGAWRWPDTLGDVVATLFWPATLFALARYRRRRWERRAERWQERRRLAHAAWASAADANPDLATR